jgi:hypothetical protein
VTERHLKLVAGCDHDLMTTGAGDDISLAAPTLPGAAGAVFDKQTEVAVSMMSHALDAAATAMFGGPVRGRRS